MQRRDIPTMNLAPLLLTALFGLLLLAYAPMYISWGETQVARAELISWLYASLATSAIYAVAFYVVLRHLANYWKAAPPTARNTFTAAISFFLMGTLIVISHTSTTGGLANNLLDHLMRNPTVGRIVSQHGLCAASYIGLINIAIFLMSWGLQQLDARRLGMVLRDIRTLMYSSAAVMALTVFQFNRLIAWGAVYKGAGEAVVAAYTVGTGLIFSLLLLFIFGPSMFTADRRLGELLAAATIDTKLDKEIWLIKNNISVVPFQEITALTGFALPLLSALASNAIPGAK